MSVQTQVLEDSDGVEHEVVILWKAANPIANMVFTG